MAATTDTAIANELLKGTPLAGQGAAFVAQGEGHNVDWRLLIAIAKAETSLATDPAANAVAIHNPFGLGPGNSYPSWDAAIGAAATTIENYRKEGRTSIAQIGAKWAPVGASNDPSNLNSNWVRVVTAVFQGYGGDPNKTTAVGGGSIGSGLESIPGDAADVAGDVAGAVTGPIDAVLGFIKDYAPRILAFVLIGVVAVWLLGQGASKAFGTPAPGAVLKNATPIGRAAA